MSEVMAYCGLLCSECPAYKATVADDKQLREETAKLWGSMYNTTIDPNDVRCLGCKSDVLFSHCNVCDIRACAKEAGHENCGKCADFACGKLDGILSYDAGAKERLSKK
jgi:hypothetical protein